MKNAKPIAAAKLPSAKNPLSNSVNIPINVNMTPIIIRIRPSLRSRYKYSDNTSTTFSIGVVLTNSHICSPLK